MTLRIAHVGPIATSIPPPKSGSVQEMTSLLTEGLVEGDLRDRDLILRLFDEHRPGRVAHLAAMAGVRYSVERAALYGDVNILGSIHMMDAARQFARAIDEALMGASLLPR